MSNIKMGDLEFNLNTFFRYLYGGFLLSLVLVLIFPEGSNAMYTKLGAEKGLATGFLLGLSIIAIGSGFYVFYKVLFSEIIIDKFIHFNVYKCNLFDHPEERCSFKYLERIGVSNSQVITAFRFIRDTLFKDDIQKIFHRRHSEIHVLYQTSVILFLGGLIKTICHSTSMNLAVLLSFSILFFLAGFIADKNLCEDELAYLKSFKEDNIIEKLKNVDLLS